MTESRVFQLLLENSKSIDFNCEYPKLHDDTVQMVSNSLTEIIYDTLKSKSTSSSFKRANVLRFLNIVFEVKDIHSNENTYMCYLKCCKNIYYKNASDPDMIDFFNENRYELNSLKVDDLNANILKFYQRKNARQREIVKQTERMKQVDQDMLDLKFNCQVRKKVVYYETNENTIKSLLDGTQTNEHQSESVKKAQESYDFRGDQFKLAYALVNLNSKTENGFLIQILLRLSKYSDIQLCEVNFLLYLWKADLQGDNFIDFIVDNFAFVYEKIILKYCTEIIKLNSVEEVCIYFENLENAKHLVKLRAVCKQNLEMCNKIKGLIFELYCYSFCNKNLLKFHSLFQ